MKKQYMKWLKLVKAKAITLRNQRHKIENHNLK